MKKSVIDELVERIEKFQGKNWIPKKEVKKWKEAHKQEIIEAHYEGSYNTNGNVQAAEQYYKETYLD